MTRAASHAAAHADQHARLVRRVHAAKSGLKLDEDTYRAAIAAHADGKTSSKACTVAELEGLMEHFHARGYPRPDGKTGGKRIVLTSTQKKMWALWQTLHAAGKVRDRSMKGLLAWIRGQTSNHVEALNFLTPAQEHTLIESLKQWQARDGA
jgi:phage gp16-like protein